MADDRHLHALAEAEPRVFWLDRPDAPSPQPQLVGAVEADLLIVGGGFTGLWAAILARQQHPDLDIVLVEAEAVAFGGSGRNGGFCDASLTHGLANGLARFPEELDRLLALGRASWRAIGDLVAEHAIDCAWEETGTLGPATAPYQVAGLAEEAAVLAAHGEEVELLDGPAVRARVASPTYLGGVHHRSSTSLVDPARLAWGLRRVALDAGVRIAERTPVEALERVGTGVLARTPYGRVSARHAVLATNAFPPLVRAIGRYVVPVYDYVLVTEPLTAAQRTAIGWQGREGLADGGNQFHYYRLIRDPDGADRILFGGYDAIYHWRNGIGPHLDQRPATHAVLARHLLETFPQLEGIRFSHRWGGAIDTCSRFSVMWGTALGGRVAYAVGYTGLGVAASRFGAQVALDHLLDRSSPLLRLRMVRERPLPFPPEPLRYAAIELTRRSMAAADRNEGRRNLWLRALDRVGLGFDS